MISKESEKQTQETIDFMGVPMNDLVTFFPKITERIVKPSDLGIIATTFFHWNDSGLLEMEVSDKSGKSNWAKLNLVEVLWLKIIEVMRNFGFPIKEILVIKNNLFHNVILQLREHAEAVIKNMEQKGYSEKEIAAVKLISQFSINNQDYFNLHYKVFGTVIGGILSEILLFKRKIFLIIYQEKGETFLAIEGYRFQEFSKEVINNVKKQPHFIIPVNDVLAEFLTNEKGGKISESFGLISNQEEEILKAIREKKVREIVIKKDQNDKFTITSTARGELTEEKVKLVKRLLCMNEYDDVRIVLRNNKNIYLENRTKRKL